MAQGRCTNRARPRSDLSDVSPLRRIVAVGQPDIGVQAAKQGAELVNLGYGQAGQPPPLALQRGDNNLVVQAPALGRQLNLAPPAVGAVGGDACLATCLQSLDHAADYRLVETDHLANSLRRTLRLDRQVGYTRQSMTATPKAPKRRGDSWRWRRSTACWKFEPAWLAQSASGRAPSPCLVRARPAEALLSLWHGECSNRIREGL